MKTAAAAVLAFALPSLAFAQGTILTVAWTGAASLIDSTTGVATPLGASGASSLNSLAGDPTNGTFYSVGSSNLYTINPMTGAATFTGVTLTVSDVRALAISGAGTCYAIVNGSPDTLHTVNLTTGVATLVGPTASSSMQALAVDASGALFAWAVNPTASGGGTLYSVSATTGASSVIGAIASGTAIQALAFSPSGVLYGCGSSLYTMDTTTAAATPVGSGYGDVRGIEFTTLGSSIGTVTFFPTNAQVGPGSGLAVYFTASNHPGELFVPVISCTTGTAMVPGLPQPLNVAWDACTNFYFANPSVLIALQLTGIPGSYYGFLDVSGVGIGAVVPPVGSIPPGLNLPVYVTFVTYSPITGLEVQGVGTFTLI